VDLPDGSLTIDGPVCCLIRVQGALDPWWSDRLGGLRIAASPAGGVPTSELRGELLDQAALIGVLTTLYDLGLPLLAVACTTPFHRAGPPGDDGA
jgi:hypothetical protein